MNETPVPSCLMRDGPKWHGGRLKVERIREQLLRIELIQSEIEWFSDAGDLVHDSEQREVDRFVRRTVRDAALAKRCLTRALAIAELMLIEQGK